MWLWFLICIHFTETSLTVLNQTIMDTQKEMVLLSLLLAGKIMLTHLSLPIKLFYIDLLTASCWLTILSSIFTTPVHISSTGN